MNEEITIDNAPGILLALAARIESVPQDREAIAAGFRVIAAVLMPCEDCGAELKAEAGGEPGQGQGVDLVDTAGQV